MNESRKLCIDITETRRAGRVHQVEGARKTALETGRTRLMVTGVVFALAFLMIAGRLVDLSVMGGVYEPRQAPVASVPLSPVNRADVLDRNGVILATSLPTAGLYADPAQFAAARENPQQAAIKLSGVLPGLDHDLIVERLKSPGRFVWIRRNLTPNQQQAINGLGIVGLHFKRGERRVYPHGRTAAHVLGLTDVDGHGIAGTEQSHNERLAAGEAVRLSLDIRIQAMLRDELLATVQEFQALGAAGVVLDVRSGQVLAMASLPDFDPNDPSSLTDAGAFNRVAKGVYELGSTFKVLNTAIALDTGVTNLGDSYDAREPIRHAGHVISDFHPEKRWLSVPEILVHSSNIGSAKMAMAMGTETQKTYLNKLGLLAPATIELPEIGRPLWPKPWRDINTMTISYGHGIAVSPLQLAGGIAAVINGGTRTPTTLMADAMADTVSERVFSPRTSETMRRLLRRVVTDGTGRRGAAPGYRVGGKTGTAEKMVAGSYRKDRLISSFVGAFPMDDPRYLILVVLDEPKGNESTGFYATAGWTAAPTVGRMVTRMAPLVGVTPEDVNDEQTPPNGRAVIASLKGEAPTTREHRLAAY